MLLQVKIHAEFTETRDLGEFTRRTGEGQADFGFFAAFDRPASHDCRSKLVYDIFVGKAEYQEDPHSLCYGDFRLQDQATPAVTYVNHVCGKPVRSAENSVFCFDIDVYPAMLPDLMDIHLFGIFYADDIA